MKRAFYSDSVEGLLAKSLDEILGKLASGSDFDVELAQRDAWLEEIQILKTAQLPPNGSIYFEFSIPRMGRRVDVILLSGPVVFVLEFKIGERHFPLSALDQVLDYALDLKYFHEPSHNCVIAPILVVTGAENREPLLEKSAQQGDLYLPIKTNASVLGAAIREVLQAERGEPIISESWETGRYRPTPTIIEAALALYNRHSVVDISRSDASAINLGRTSKSISAVIEAARSNSRKAICFVTGVPGAGKTLVGLNLATTHSDRASELHSVFLSGNGPLVAILCEALARDKVRQEKERGRKVNKGLALREVKAFIQNVHHFRDALIRDPHRPPYEHVAIFDEAQRAWTVRQTANFMKRKKNHPNFDKSEPEFLISCMDRHKDWAVILCLVGGGQEINTGEAGITEWIETLVRSFPRWDIHISPHLKDSEYEAGEGLRKIEGRQNVTYNPDLHLAVSMRSFRAENVSQLVKEILDVELEQARETLRAIGSKYPILLTRNLTRAKRWLRNQALGTERYGIVVSSQAERLKPEAIHVKAPLDPVHWFLDGKEDVRSSYYLEDAATEFDVQGLELDWTCVTWDADFRHTRHGWEYRSFRGDRWNRINQDERRRYLKNAYRVLLTRARQGMVIVVPPGDQHDPTRAPEFYDPTFEYLVEVGIPLL